MKLQVPKNTRQTVTARLTDTVTPLCGFLSFVRFRLSPSTDRTTPPPRSESERESTEPLSTVGVVVFQENPELDLPL